MIRLLAVPLILLSVWLLYQSWDMSRWYEGKYINSDEPYDKPQIIANTVFALILLALALNLLR